MTIYAPTEGTSQAALRKRAERGTVRALHRGLYTDELERLEEEIVRENILAIAAVLLPDYQLSHRSAAVRGLVSDLLFMSGRQLRAPARRGVATTCPYATSSALLRVGIHRRTSCATKPSGWPRRSEAYFR